MKKIYVYISLFCLLTTSLFSQTKTVGTSGADYQTLFDAFYDINNGNLTGAIVLQIKDNTTEPSTAELFPSGYGGISSYSSITIYPTVSGKTISGDFDAPLISITGASNITIDGRVTRAGAKNLIITNKNTGTSASTIQFSESASNNLIEYCVIKGAGTGATSGVIFFTTATTGSGNSANTIIYNDITCDPAGRPVNALYSNGTPGSENSGNTISENSFYNFLKNGTASNGILLSSNTTAFTISGNSFYETASFAPTASVAYNIIKIDNTSGIGFSITGNYFGGQSASCGGSAWTKTGAFDNIFNAIYINAGTGTASILQNNTIRNFSWSNSAAATWTGINIAAGDVNIGTTTGNTIGAATGTGSVAITAGATNTNVYGVLITGTGTVDCESNYVGSITTANTNTNNATHFYGIRKTSTAGTTTISNNIIGSTSTANSINGGSASSSNAQYVFGIWNAGTGNVAINGNTIANLTNSSTNSTAGNTGLINGIYSADGTNTISNNVVRDLTISNANTASDQTASVGGIVLMGSTLKTISGNTIYDLINTYASFAGSITGLYFTGNTGANSVTANFIYGLSATGASSTAASLYGIKMNAGATTYANNIISLGGNTQTTLYGIYETGVSGNNNLYFNTVYINGAPAAGSANSYALYSAGTANTRNIRNNIFDNARSNSGATGKHYAIYLATITGATTDYNNYYTPGTGGTTGYLGGDIADLAAWKTATSQDTHSLSTNPAFPGAGGTNASGYIPVTSLPGVSGTGITTDYNGALRAGTPTMGAFEGGSCSNPTDGGNISTAQNGCSPLDPAAFSATVPTGYTGSSLEYQWQLSTTNSTSGFGNITGATASTYDAGPLSVTTWFKRLSRVSCIGTWSGAAESNVIEVTVNQLPNTGLTVSGSGSVCSGSGTNITVALSASGVNYQLRNSSVPIGSPQAGNGGTLTFPTGNLTSNTTFNILATNATTSCSAQLSQTATVTVNALPNTGLSVGGSGSVCNGSSTNITVALSETGVNYQLRDGSTPVGSAVAGNNGTISLPTGSMTSNITFNVLATNATTSCSAQLSQTVTVSVNPLPNTGLAVGGSGGVCSGTGTNITVDLSVSGVNYQLRNGVVNVGSPVAGNGGTINLPTGNLTTNTTFNVLAINASTSCSAQETQTATVNVNALPNTGLTVSGSGSVCSGTGTNFTVVLSDIGVIYQLRNGVVNVGTAVTGTGGTITLPTGNLTSATTFNVYASTISTGCSVQLTQTATVNTDPVSVGGTVGGTASITYGSSTGTMTLTGYTGIIQRWEKRFNSGSWTTVSNTSPTYSETPASTGTWGYRAVMKSGACSEANSSEFSVTVNKATPVITWSNPADIVQNTPLSSTQLNATADVPGSFIYTPAAGTILSAGPNQTLSVSFTPGDVTNYNTTSKNVLINVTVLTGIADVQEKAITVYPNPAGGIITIEGLSSLSGGKTITLVITDNYGKTIILKPLEKNIKTLSVDISKYASGVYFIILQTDKGKIVKQFVKR